MKTLPKPDGKLRDLPEGATTMWEETTYQCPISKDHTITGSTRKLYCAKCGVWWERK